jgi:biopolymer transport protein ExbD
MKDEARPHPSSASTVSDINVTPLIDVMLVLLIIFMGAMPIIHKSLEVSLPRPNPSPTQVVDAPSIPLVLALEEVPGAGPVISLNKQAVSGLEDLAVRLRDIFQGRSDRTLFVKVSGSVPYGRVVDAMDVARGAGAERMGLMSEARVPPAAP